MITRRFSNEQLLAMAADGNISAEELAKLWNDERRNFPPALKPSEFGSDDETPEQFFERTGARL